MHVQTDFVTNSSSTAYIIFIPDNFQVSDRQIDKALQICKLNIVINFKMSDEELEEVADIVDMMKDGEQFDFYGCENLWLLCFEIFNNENFILDGIECNDGNATMKGVDQKSIINTITNHVDLDDLVKSLVKGSNHERQVNKKENE